MKLGQGVSRGGRTQITFTVNCDLLMKFFYTCVIHFHDNKLTLSAVHAELAPSSHSVWSVRVHVGVRNLAE